MTDQVSVNSIDAIYDFIDDRLLLHQYMLVDAICERWETTGHPALTLAVLTATLPAKDKLPSRQQLINEFRAKIGSDTLMLKGLE